MSFLAPWAMVLGAAGAGAVVLLHLVALHRPAVYLLPTARFIPERQTLVSRAASRPRDLLYLLLRVLLLLCAGAAFAQPVFTAAHSGTGRIVLVDQSADVAQPGAALAQGRAFAGAAQPALLVPFDSGESSSGSVTDALITARRAAPALAQGADSVELIIVSPLTTSEFDAATAHVRALWPGSIRIERVAARATPSRAAGIQHAPALDDPRGPALAAVSRDSSATVRLVRSGAPSPADSGFARAGGTVVVWNNVTAPTYRAEGLALGHDVIVAPLARLPLPSTGRVTARWHDGAPASREQVLGTGCIRTVGVGVPSRGDLPLRPAFQRIVRGLTASCTGLGVVTLADSGSIARLRGSGSIAPARLLRSTAQVPSRIVPWLFGVALTCALLELLLRATSRMRDPETS